METPLSDKSVKERLLLHARTLYQQLTDELVKALESLEKGTVDTEAKGRAETIRAHRKALNTVLEIETQFIKDAEKANSVGAINLDAAREEIYRRFDSLMVEGPSKKTD